MYRCANHKKWKIKNHCPLFSRQIIPHKSEVSDGIYEANDAELMSPGRMFGFCKGAEQRLAIHLLFHCIEVCPYGK